MSQTLEALVVELKADVRGLQTSLQSAAGDVQRFSNRASDSVSGFESSILRARAAVVGLAIAWAGFRIGKGIVDAGVQLEAMRSKMLAATGGAAVAADAFAFVRAEADRLGLSVQTTANGFAGFSASALRAGMTLQQTKEIFTGVSEAAVSMRLPAEQTALVFKALEQIAGKGTVSMEELRGQLGDALPGAFEIAAKAMGKSTAEFSKMVANGEVLATDFLPRFGAAIRKELGGSVGEASQGAQAAFNRLGNAFFDLKTQMADSGFLDSVVASVNQLTFALNDPATIEGLKGFAALMGDIVTAATSAASAIGNFYSEAVTKRQAYLQAMQEFKDEGRWFVGTGEVNKRVEDNAFRKRIIDQYTAKKTAEAAGKRPQSTQVPGSYTLGTASAPSPSAAQSKAVEKAAREAQQLREQLASQAESLRYQFASPEGQATMDVEKQQETLRKALEAKAITEQEFRELSLEAEMDYQERLKEIRDKAREEELSALEGFLGARISSEDEIRQRSLADQGKNFRETIAQAANHHRVFFAIEKAASLARALISARESVVSAYAFGSRIGGPPLGAVFAGVAAAAQAANIAAIASTSFNGGGGASVGSSGGDGGGYASGDAGQAGGTSGTTKEMTIRLQGTDMSLLPMNQVRELIDRINEAGRDGARVQVVYA